MSAFPVHTADSAPDGSRKSLQDLQANVGFIPNLAATMAESPQLLRGFLAVGDIYRNGSFSPGEVQVLSLTAAFENACAWCMAFHSFMAEKEGVSQEDIAALRAGRSPSELRLRALSDFARTMIRQRGAVTKEDLAAFSEAGFTPAQAMEVVLGMAFSVMANYAGHLADAPIDPPFKPFAWESASMTSVPVPQR